MSKSKSNHISIFILWLAYTILSFILSIFSLTLTFGALFPNETKVPIWLTVLGIIVSTLCLVCLTICYSCLIRLTKIILLGFKEYRSKAYSKLEDRVIRLIILVAVNLFIYIFSFVAFSIILEHELIKKWLFFPHTSLKIGFNLDKPNLYIIFIYIIVFVFAFLTEITSLRNILLDIKAYISNLIGNIYWGGESCKFKRLVGSNHIVRKVYINGYDQHNKENADTERTEIGKRLRLIKDLSYVDFSDAHPDFFAGVDLSGIDFTGSTFKSGANFSMTKLVKANLSNVNLEGANFEEADFTDANLTKTDLKRATLIKTNFTRAICIETNFTGAIFYNPDLESNLEINLTGANLTKAKFKGADLRDAKLMKTICIETDFEEVNFSSAYLIDANLNKANLKGSNLKNAKLVRAICIETDFEAADFTGACLEDWHPIKCNLNLTKCSYFNLSEKGLGSRGDDFLQTPSKGCGDLPENTFKDIYNQNDVVKLIINKKDKCKETFSTIAKILLKHELENNPVGYSTRDLGDFCEEVTINSIADKPVNVSAFRDEFTKEHEKTISDPAQAYDEVCHLSGQLLLRNAKSFVKSILGFPSSGFRYIIGLINITVYISGDRMRDAIGSIFGDGSSINRSSVAIESSIDNSLNDIKNDAALEKELGEGRDRVAQLLGELKATIKNDPEIQKSEEQLSEALTKLDELAKACQVNSKENKSSIVKSAIRGLIGILFRTTDVSEVWQKTWGEITSKLSELGNIFGAVIS
jgi:uncharacterized protein YjbI with pentapeptide repeats